MLKRLQIYRCLNKIINLATESPVITGDNLITLYNDFSESIHTLSDLGCIQVACFDDEPCMLTLLDHAFTYKLERSEIWMQRIFGFITGVATTLFAEFLIKLLL